LPPDLTATAMSGAGWSCTLASLTCTRSDTLAPAGSYSAITLAVTVSDGASTSVTNSVAVSGGGESNVANDSASDPTTIRRPADLTLTSSHAAPFTQGQSGAVYTVTATNAGTGPTVGALSVSDALPAGLTATAMAGAGWACTLQTLTCTRSDVAAAG